MAHGGVVVKEHASDALRAHPALPGTRGGEALQRGVVTKDCPTDPHPPRSQPRVADRPPAPAAARELLRPSRGRAPRSREAKEDAQYASECASFRLRSAGACADIDLAPLSPSDQLALMRAENARLRAGRAEQRTALAALRGELDASRRHVERLTQCLALDCAVCLQPPLAACECTTCGTLGCARCFAQLPRCPVCRTAPFRSQPSRAVQHLLARTPVPCPLGCGLVVDRCDVAAHQRTCCAAPFACAFGCGCVFRDARKPAVARGEHEAVCPLRPVTCRQCGGGMPAAELVVHSRVCPAVRVVCPHCRVAVARDGYATHALAHLQSAASRVVRCVTAAALAWLALFAMVGAVVAFCRIPSWLLATPAAAVAGELAAGGEGAGGR